MSEMGMVDPDGLLTLGGNEPLRAARLLQRHVGLAPVSIRTGVVTAIASSTQTVSVDVAGAVVPGIPFIVGASLIVGQSVILLTLPGGYLCLGAAAGSETGWIRPGAAGGPTWGPGWTDNTATAEFAVMKRVGNTVKVRGIVWRTSGSSNIIMVLPNGSRPARFTYRPALMSGTWAYLSIDPSGNVAFAAGGGSVVNSTSAVAFEFEFDLDQP